MNLIKKIENFQIMDLINHANNITLKEHGRHITLERAILLSWWCDKGDCAFCYMSTQKSKIREPEKARRNVNSILAEVELCTRMGWEIEFLSGGYGAFSTDEIKSISENIYKITGKPVWLNIGVTKDLEAFGDEIVGIYGAIETVNPDLHLKICPSKSIDDVVEILEIAGDLGFKKAITIILGLGESPMDLKYLFQLIKDVGIDRVTFYSLNPHRDTYYENTPQPASLYYAGVVSATRIKFPKLKIICGTWVDNLANIGPLVLSGANGLTKFPLFRMFGTNYGMRVEEEVIWSGRELIGTFTDFARLMGEENPNPKIEAFIKRYIERCLNSKSDPKAQINLLEED